MGSFLVRKLFEGGNYLSAETNEGNTVYAPCMHALVSLLWEKLVLAFLLKAVLAFIGDEYLQ